MNNEQTMDLQRLFQEIPEPGKDEGFTRRVARRIALRRYVRRILVVLLAVLGVALMSALTPWILRQFGQLGIGLVSASGILAVLVSRVGWVLGLVAAIFVFFKTRA